MTALEPGTGNQPIPSQEPLGGPDLAQGTSELEDRGHIWIRLMILGAVILMLGVVLIRVSIPASVALIITGLLMIARSLLERKLEIDEVASREANAEWGRMEETIAQENELKAREEAEKLRIEERQKEVEEIVKEVKSTIRVRCQYCGTLNEETANKCESCGATL